MKSYQEFFAELKRRHVFKVAAVYGGVAFLLLQVAELLGQGMRLPDSFLPFVTAIVLLGFPLALVIAWAFQVTPDGVQRTASASPGELEAIAALPASKRWPAGLLALAGFAALMAGTWWAGNRAGASGDSPSDAERASSVQLALADDGRPSIAVLPFADMSPDGDQEYFSDGITEEILGTLVKIRDLKVAARSSAFAFKDQDIDLRVVGDSLGVSYLIEGSVRKAGDELRITAQLIDAADGSQLWSDSYDRTMNDVFAIQREIAEAIAGELRIPLGLDGAADLVTPTGDLEAYDLYLAARGHLRERGAGVMEAIRLFEAAVARDSTWAPAWAGLAEAREVSAWYPQTWDEPMPADPAEAREHWRTGFRARLGPAEEAARLALALDPENASAHVALGSVLRDRRRWDEAEAEYRDALSLDPDNAEGYHQYAEMLSGTGRIAEAIPLMRRGMALDPAPIRQGMLGWGLLVDDRLEEAVPMLERAVESAGGRLPIIRDLLMDAYIDSGRFPDAERLARATPDSAATLQKLAALRAGDPEAMPGELTAEEWLRFGEENRALETLVALGDALSNLDIYSLWQPVFDPIRDRPEFDEILRRANLEGREIERSPR